MSLHGFRIAFGLLPGSDPVGEPTPIYLPARTDIGFDVVDAFVEGIAAGEEHTNQGQKGQAQNDEFFHGVLLFVMAQLKITEAHEFIEGFQG